jgi:uncharacterized protein with HEPN domain
MHLEDILDSISLIDQFLAGIDFDSYVKDIKTKSAVERQLQIITEPHIDWAMKRIRYVPAPTGRGSWEWVISSGTRITG